MQKKLIALAVAGLASTAAFAQTNVTIYGLVDYGYSYRWDGKNAGSSIPGVNTGTPNSQSQLNGGQQSGNRLGFKGTEDLGNGLKAVFLLEQGFMLDTGMQQTSGSQFTRQAYMGLSGNFGTVVGGRLYTPHYTFVSGLDPFGAGTVGRYNNVYSPASAVTGSTLMDPVRVDNALAYVSPSFLGGLTATLAFSNNAGGQEDSSSNSNNNTVYAGLLKYENGPIVVGANYHYINGGSRISTISPTFGIDNVQNATLGGSYDFKVAKVMALYSWNDVDYTNVGSGNATLNNYMLGVTAPFGKFTGKASYIYSDGNRSAGGDAQQFAVGVDYNLSKRTNLYSAYSFINNDDQRLNGVGDASNSGGYTATNGYALPGVFQQGLQVGVRHSF
jgi:predicted porin